MVHIACIVLLFLFVSKASQFRKKAMHGSHSLSCVFVDGLLDGASALQLPGSMAMISVGVIRAL